MSQVNLLEELRQHGVLLLQDKTLRSVVGLITGEALSGSWWSHPKAQAIFAAAEELDGHEDVVVTRLAGGKVTFVHRALWPALLAVATSNAPWQTRRLSAHARRLLRQVDQPIEASGPAAKELQERLLVHAGEVHTESGRHAVVLQPWSQWARTKRVKAMADETAAREALEAAVVGIGGRARLLPWQRFSSKTR